MDFKNDYYTAKNVELNWAKLTAPIKTQWGTSQWELQMATTDKAVADEWTSNHFNVKPVLDADKNPVSPAKYSVNLKRKAMKADNNPNTPVRVVDSSKQELSTDARASIGNGSVGNVMIYQYAYDAMGNKGIANSLTAVQVTDLKEYNPVPDFDSVEPVVTTSSEPAEMPF